MRNYWQKRPYLLQHALPNLYHAFTLTDLKPIVDEQFLDAGLGYYDPTTPDKGWRMAPVSVPRGNTFAEAKLQYEDVLKALSTTSGKYSKSYWHQQQSYIYLCNDVDIRKLISTVYHVQFYGVYE